MKPCRAQYTLRAILFALGTASLLSGCGAKGELYRPTPKPAATTAPSPAPASAPAPASTPEQPKTTN